jgi:hypothetical protein
MTLPLESVFCSAHDIHVRIFFIVLQLAPSFPLSVLASTS